MRSLIARAKEAKVSFPRRSDPASGNHLQTIGATAANVAVRAHRTLASPRGATNGALNAINAKSEREDSGHRLRALERAISLSLAALTSPSHARFMTSICNSRDLWHKMRFLQLRLSPSSSCTRLDKIAPAINQRRRNPSKDIVQLRSTSSHHDDALQLFDDTGHSVRAPLKLLSRDNLLLAALTLSR